jgi:hypothetical protein
MAISWTADARSLTAEDVAGLTAAEQKILGRLVVSEPVYTTHDLDPTGVLMTYDGNGAQQRAKVPPGSVAIALLKGWVLAYSPLKRNPGPGLDSLSAPARAFIRQASPGLGLPGLPNTGVKLQSSIPARLCQLQLLVGRPRRPTSAL